MIAINHTNGCITIEGHANYAPHGQDIVCAAVSTLVQTFLWSVDGLTEDVINSFTEPGKTVIRYGNLSANAQLLLDSFFLGVQMIADNYPANVRITNE